MRHEQNNTTTLAPLDMAERIYLHNQVAELMLGRKLLPTERVIHLNGHGMDCQRANLKVIQATEAGQYQTGSAEGYAYRRPRAGGERDGNHS